MEKDKVIVFIVEREFGGIISGKFEDKFGIRGFNSKLLYIIDYCKISIIR